LKKLVVYGDSFAENKPVNDFTIGWSILLAAKLKLHYINNAIGGSSIEYSIKKFTHDKLSNDLSADDIIIFIFSNPGRQHLIYQTKNPSSAARFSAGNKWWTDNHASESLDKSYYYANEEHIRWFEYNKDNDIYKLNASSYIHMLNSYARNNPSSTLIILNMNPILHPIDVPVLDNFLISNTSLLKVSNNEFASGINFTTFTKKTKTDPRCNHLSNPNIVIFAELLHKVILNKDVGIINYDSFLKNILDRNILSQEDYFYYLKKDLLYNSYIHLNNIGSK
jgi:hypothetical protein